MRKFLGRQGATGRGRDIVSRPLIASIEIDAALFPDGHEWNISFSDSHVFHISLRANYSTLVLNELVDGEYLDETRIPFIPYRLLHLKLEFVGDRVVVFADGDLIVERGLARDLGPNPHGIFDWSTHASPAVEQGRDVRDFVLFKEVIRAPSAGAVARFRPIDVDLARIFVEAAKVLVFGEKPIFVDLSDTRGLVSKIVRSLFPRASIYYVSQREEEGDGRGFEGSDIDNLNFVDFEDIGFISSQEKLRKNGGIRNRVVVIGSDLLGDDQSEKCKALVELRRLYQDVTIISNESECVPAYKVFGGGDNVDVYINVFWDRWKCIWDSSRRIGMRPSLDIVVAMYNTEEYIEDCVRSLTSFGRLDVNVIVVDDGSTDGSADVVARLAEELSNVTLLQKPNGGCASARNFGRLNSGSSHIAFVDADDYVDAGTFEFLFELALYSNNPIVQAGFTTVGLAEQEGTEEASDAHLATFSRQVSMAGRSIVKLHPHDALRESPGIWRRVYRRDFLDGKNIWFPEHIRAYDDFIFFVLSTRYSSEILHVPDFRYYYRQHANQDVRKRDARHFYVIEMGHMLLLRATTEAWKDISILTDVLRASINWSLTRVDVRYLGRYVSAAASLVALIETAFGKDVFSCAPEDFISDADYRSAYLFEKHCLAEADMGMSYVGAFVRTPGMNAEVIEAIASAQDKRLS